MTVATRTKTNTSNNKPQVTEPEAQQPVRKAPKQASSKSKEIAYIEPNKQPRKAQGDIGRKDARELIGILDSVAKPLTDSIESYKSGIESIKKSAESRAKDRKALAAAVQSQIDADEKTLKGIADVKESINARIGKATGEGVLEEIANTRPKDITKPEAKAQAILAAAAQSLIEKGRSPRPVMVVKSVKLERLVPITEGKKGSTAQRERILPGVAYSDRKGQRLSRTRRRRFKRIKLT